MSQSLASTQNFSLNGVAFNWNKTITSDNLAASSPSSIGVAVAGELTTRTDNDTGTLTMDSAGHGIQTGDRLDLYWDGGARIGMTVGTVSGTSVPIDLGSGDNLPALNTDIRASVPTEEALVVTGNDAVAFLITSNLSGADWSGYVTFTTSGDALIASYELTGDQPSNEWDSGLIGTTNPLAGQTVSKVYFSHGNLESRTMGASVLYD